MHGALARQVRPRVVVAAVVLPLVLVVALVAGWARERGSLSGAAARVRTSVLDATELVGCFQGVQDDLIPGPSGGWLPTTVVAATRRLRGCDVSTLRAHLGAVDIPRAAAVLDDRHRAARADLVRAAAMLRRVLVEARGTRRAMEVNLDTGKQGATLVVGYRATEAAYQQAAFLLERATALLQPPTPAVTPAI
jgi:hypothetical protein